MTHNIINLRSTNSGELIRSYSKNLFGTETNNPDAAINNHLMCQRIKKILSNIHDANDSHQMFKLFENEEYYLRGNLNGPKRSGYVFLYLGETLICEMGFCLNGITSQRVWGDLGGLGFAPQAPFLAIKNAVDINFIPKWLIYFCKLLSWAWLDHINEYSAKHENNSELKS
ncbi:TPA: hypothetical protein ACGIK9_002842 [Acinetobacter baumannii]|uniref:hypothetical protein n=1 Tax=Acinetobacter baumannii TaxID=470 RepID=UPI00338EAE2D